MRINIDIQITDEQYSHLTRGGMISESDAIERLIIRNFNKSSKPGVLSVEDFLFSNFDFNLDRRVPAAELHKLYLSECDRLNCSPISRNSLYQELRVTPGLHLRESSGNRLWIYGLEE